MQIEIKRFDQLSREELYAILKLRVDVFVVEQQCPYPDLDDHDQQALHVFMTDEDGIEAYLRILDRGVVSPEECRHRLAADPDSGFADIDADELPESPDDGELGSENMAGFAGGDVDAPERHAPHLDDVDKAGAVFGGDA